jgi:hypothetical protein
LKSYFTGTQYSAQIPLVLSGTTFELDFSGLTDYGEENPITNTTEFVVSTDGVKVLRALTYEKLLNQIDTYVNTNLDVIASAPLVITNPFPTKTAFSYDMDSMSAITDVQVGDTILLHAGTLSAPNYLNRKMTGLQLKSYIANKGSNFGTTPSGHIDIGNTTYQTRIAGNAIYLNNSSNGEIIFQGSGNFVYLYLLEDSGSLVRSNGLNIAGYFQATAKVTLGNSTNNTEVFGDDVAISGGLATGSSSGGFTRRLNIFNRGLYLYQSPWGGSGNSTVGRASWLITPGFQQFRLEFHLTATDGTLIFLSYINGVGVYVVEYSFTGQHKSKMQLKESPRKAKRFRLVFDDASFVDFGAKGARTFIDGRTQKEKLAWIARHKNDGGYNDPKKGIYYSRYLLWTETSLKKAVKSLEKKLGKKIDVLV